MPNVLGSFGAADLRFKLRSTCPELWPSTPESVSPACIYLAGSGLGLDHSSSACLHFQGSWGPILHPTPAHTPFLPGLLRSALVCYGILENNLPSLHTVLHIPPERHSEVGRQPLELVLDWLCEHLTIVSQAKPLAIHLSSRLIVLM